MGGSSSVCNTPRRQAISAFVDDSLRQGEVLLKMDSSSRTKFVEFVKGGTWTDSLIKFEDILNHLISSSDSPWRKFGYKAPHLYNGRSARSSFDKESSFKSYSTESECDSPSKSKSSSCMYKQMILDECYTAISTCHLFKKEELRPILIAALLPLFMKNCEGSCTQNNSSANLDEGIEDEDGDGEEEEGAVVVTDDMVRAFDFVKAKTVPTLKSERLQEWLLGAAAMFDSFELEAYLAETPSWIDDYLQALHNLPVSVTLSTVDPSKHESKIIYANSSQGTRGQVGANMHEVYSADSTAFVVGQVTKAVFSAKKYKRAVVTPNGLYKLRALKPVFDLNGQHVFTLGLESSPFEDPIITDKFKEQAEEPFQQIEDLLLMLPLLIRNYGHNGQNTNK